MLTLFALGEHLAEPLFRGKDFDAQDNGFGRVSGRDLPDNGDVRYEELHRAGAYANRKFW